MPGELTTMIEFRHQDIKNQVKTRALFPRMDSFGFLRDYIAEQFSHKYASPKDPWPVREDVILFQNNETGQSLMYEYAESLAARAFLKMCDLPFCFRMESNAEYMSPTGRVPLLKAGKMVVGGFDGIVDLVSMKGINLCALLENKDLAAVRAYIDMVHDVLVKAEIFICWNHESTYNQLTKLRYSSVYSFPLNHIVTWQRKREMQHFLQSCGWSTKNFDEILDLVNDCCRSLSAKLGENSHFILENSCTEVDALVFGHLFTILTTELPAEVDLAPVVRRYPNLVSFCRRIEKDYFTKDGSELSLR